MDTSAKTESGQGRALGNIQGVEMRDRGENRYVRPNGLREKVGSAISGGGPGPRRKENRCTSSWVKAGGDAQNGPRDKATESRTHTVGGCGDARRNETHYSR